MQISCKLSVQAMNSPDFNIPKKHADVTDSLLERILRLSGLSQRMVDVSRCSNLSRNCVNFLSLCQNILYLDMSYTAINSVDTLADNCLVIRSLYLCGTNLTTCESLSKMTSLELLNLSFSSFSNTTTLSPLIKLRSLDLGHSKINSIMGLSSMSRLEELLIDSSELRNQKYVKQSLEVLGSLKELKLLNVGGTELAAWTEQISPLASQDLYIDCSTRM